MAGLRWRCRQCSAKMRVFDVLCAKCKKADASPDEARRILAELLEATSAPAPLEDCPFTLSAPKAKRITRTTQPELF